MLNPQVVTYIRDQLSMGVHPDVIKQNLKQGGGWTDAVIEENFSAANNETVHVSNIPQSDLRDRNIRRRIFATNIIIFGLYTALGLLLGYPEASFSVYFIHAAILGVVSLVLAVAELSTKKKTYAGEYFLVAILICIIGFGTCTFLATSGLMNL